MKSLRHASPTPLLTYGFIVLSLLWGGLLGFRQIAGLGSVLDGIEYLTLDWRFVLTGARPAPPGVVVVAIDDETIRIAGGYPLSRNTIAGIVRGIAALNPRAIAIDIAFLDRGEATSNAQLAEALGSTKSVIAAIGLFDREEAPAEERGADEPEAIPNPSSILWPLEAFRTAATPALVNIATDSNGVPRFIPLIYRIGENTVPSFALAASAAASNAAPVFGLESVNIAGTSSSTDLGYHLPIRYYGPRGAIRHLSASRILKGGVDPRAVRDQIVVVGYTALGVGDAFATPFDRIVPGVEIFATGVSNLIAGDGLIRTAQVRKIDAAAAIILPCLAILLMAMRRAFLGMGFAGLMVVVWLALVIAAFVEGYWFNVAAPLAALVPVAAAYGAARLGLDQLIARRLAADRTALSRFQSPLLVEHILRTPGFLDRPVQQDVAAVFLDLSGFTGIAEILGPQPVRELLASLHAMIEREAMKHDGFVASFMGDGAMIVFGLPEPRPDDASRALLAVMGLYAATIQWLEALPLVARDRLSVRIGGHFGKAVVSRLGPAHHQHITATGDTVNVASRLMEVAKQQRRHIIVSEDLFAAAAPASSTFDPIAVPAFDVDIRGRERPLRIRALG